MNNSDEKIEAWPEQNSALKSPWVIGWMGMIVIVLAANITMITIAFKTRPSLVIDDYYERGKNYDKALERQAQELALGWQGEIITPEKSEVNKAAEYRFTLKDADGMPLNVNSVEFFAYRPSDANKDFSLLMAHEGDGIYKVNASFPLPGVWDLIISVEDGEKTYELPKRIFINK